MKTTFAFVILATSAAGCARGLHFSDDEGGPRGGKDDLSLPYALGTPVHVAVKNADKTAISGWKIVSDDPTKLSVDAFKVESDELRADLTARGEGDTRLRLLDAAGTELRSADVTVRAPDRARAFAHGPLRLLGREESKLAAAEVTEARVLVGGKGVFGITYYKGDQRLYGRGIASPDPIAGVTVENVKSSGAPANEWLFLSPSAPGSFDLKLRPGGVTVLTLPLVAVAEADVTTLSLGEEVAEKRNDKQQVFVLAQASDAMGRRVHGLYADWTLDGVAQKGDGMVTTGDLYRYQHQPSGASRDLAAGRGTLKSSLKITAYEGKVLDTTYLGCAVAPGRPPRAPLYLLSTFGMLWLIVRARAKRHNLAPRPVSNQACATRSLS